MELRTGAGTRDTQPIMRARLHPDIIRNPGLGGFFDDELKRLGVPKNSFTSSPCPVRGAPMADASGNDLSVPLKSQQRAGEYS